MLQSPIDTRSPLEQQVMQGYLPIESHAVIGDRRTAALVAADGAIKWWCLPNFDGEIVFGALPDAERGGSWQLGPARAIAQASLSGRYGCGANPFLPCSFWLASTLSRLRQQGEAEKILDRVDQAFGQLGIYPEEVDVHSGVALGNIPMIFSHAEHLKAVMDYAKASPLTHLEMSAGKMARKIIGTVEG